MGAYFCNVLLTYCFPIDICVFYLSCVFVSLTESLFKLGFSTEWIKIGKFGKVLSIGCFGVCHRLVALDKTTLYPIRVIFRVIE